MIDEGWFAADEQFELLEGWIVEKVSRNPPHDSVLNRTRRRIERVLPPGWITRIQSAVTTADSEPEPDIAVVRGDDSDYAGRHPEAGDAALVVEVANTTLADDRGGKLRIYAAAGFPLYWILNVDGWAVETYADPTGPLPTPGYRRRTVYGIGQSVPLPVGDVEVDLIPVADFFG